MTDTQSTQAVKSSDAYRLGIERANAPIPTSAYNDHRVEYDDIVTFTPPAHLTADYDPTYTPAVRKSGPFVVTDDAALALAALYRNPGKCPRCIDCGEPIVAGGWAKGSGLHAWCHLKREGLAR